MEQGGNIRKYCLTDNGEHYNNTVTLRGLSFSPINACYHWRKDVPLGLHTLGVLLLRDKTSKALIGYLYVDESTVPLSIIEKFKDGNIQSALWDLIKFGGPTAAIAASLAAAFSACCVGIYVCNRRRLDNKSLKGSNTRSLEEIYDYTGNKELSTLQDFDSTQVNQVAKKKSANKRMQQFSWKDRKSSEAKRLLSGESDEEYAYFLERTK